jgi:DNA-binding beta-propeller fold protein YncE
VRRARLGIGLAAALLCALFLAATASADTLWWANAGAGAGNFGHTSTAGGEGGTFAPGGSTVSTPFGLAIDSATGIAYWANSSNSSIGWGKLDGSEAGTLDTASGSVGFPIGIALDPATQTLYWANAASGTIGWSKVDGSNGGVLDTIGAPFHNPEGVVVDPALGKVYWANSEGDSIGYANLDDTGEAGELEVTGTLPNDPDGLAIDAAQGRIYWTERSGNAIHYVPLAGGESHVLDVGSAPISSPRGLAIDPAALKIYWANSGSNTVGEAPLDGTGGSQLATGTATLTDPNYPVLLQTPRITPVATPAVLPLAQVGATLPCTGKIEWEPDLVESFLYRQPERESVSWTLNGEVLNGATTRSLVATQPGFYTCRVTGTNAAGSTTGTVYGVEVQGPPSTTAPISVTLRPVTKLRILKLKYDKAHGTATLLAKVSGPGRLYLFGKNVAHRSVRSSGAGIAKLKVQAAGGALKALRATGKAKLKLQVKFVTSEGGVAKKHRAATLHLRG